MIMVPPLKKMYPPSFRVSFAFAAQTGAVFMPIA
jgi:hypothetical protein